MMANRKIFAIDDRLSLDDVAELIAELDLRPGDDKRSAKDRARKRAEYAVEKVKLIREKDDTFTFGNLVEWARDIWPDKFGNLPANLHLQANVSTSSRGVGNLDVFVKPPELPKQKDDMIFSLQRRITELETEVNKLKFNDKNRFIKRAGVRK
jgi:hypothetical protein